MTTYTFDTNVIVDLNRDQPRDVYPGPWQSLEALIEAANARMPREVYEELAAVDDECAPWAKGCDAFVVEATEAEVALVVEITNTYPTWVQGKVNYADPFVVAHAVITGSAVVTHERLAGVGVAEHNLKVPNVAADYGVQCIRFPELARQEGWVFR